MNDLDKCKDEIISELSRLKEEVASLKYQLKERVKELNCHNYVSEFTSDSSLLLSEVIEKIVQVIPESFQFPEIAEARISYYANEFATQNFEETDCLLSENIKIGGKIIGKIDVCYLIGSENKKTAIFLPEESKLLYTLAVRIAHFIEKKEKEIALNASERVYKNLIESINDVIYEIDTAGTIKYVSLAITKTLGYTPEEIIGKNIFAYVHPDDIPKLKKALKYLGKKGFSFLEYRYFTKENKICWVRISTNPIIENEEIIGVRGSLANIHKQKTAEQSLQFSEKWLKNLVNSQTNYVLRTDLEGNYTYCNNKFEKDFGWLHKTGILGSYSLDAICVYHHERAKNAVELCLKEPGRIVKVELDKPYKNNITRTTLWEFVCLTDEKDQPIEIQCNGVDITERVTAEKKLLYLSRAVEQNPTSIVITDLKGNIEYANIRASETTGYSIDELVGSNTRILKTGYTSEEEYRNLWQQISSGNEWKGVFRNKRKNGEMYWESSNIAPIMDINGQITHYLAIKEDISEKKEYEQKLLHLNQILENKVNERTLALAMANDILQKEIDVRIRVERILSAKKEEFENFFTVALDLLCIADNNGNFIRLNKAWEAILGYQISELENTPFLNFVHPDDIESTQQQIKLINDHTPISEFINRYRTKDGDYRFIEWRSVPVGDFVYAAARDITERKKYEEDLKNINDELDSRVKQRTIQLERTIKKQRESHERFFKVFHIIPDMILISTLVGNEIIVVNDSFSRQTDYFQDEIRGKTTLDINLWVDEKDRQTFVTKMNTNRKVANMETTFCKRSGEIFTALISGEIIYFAGVECILGIMRDITERKEQEQELHVYRESLELMVQNRTQELDNERNLMRILIDTLPNKIWVKDKNFKIVIANKSMLEVFGFKQAHSIIDKTDFDILPPKIAKKHRKEDIQILKNQTKIIQYEEIVTNANGQNEWYYVVKVPLLNFKNQTNGVITIYSNITPIKQAATEMEHAKELAEQANRMKSEFLANMSHEIRTPMNAILGFSEILKDKIGNNAEIIEYLEGIQKSGKNLILLINNILDFAKIEAGKLELNYIAINPNTIFNEINQIFSIVAKQKNLEFEIHIEPNLPKAIIFDELRLRQVLFNLIGNAIKFTDQGSVRVNVKAVVKTINNTNKIDLQLDICDTGIGIQKSEQIQIFEPFKQQKGQSARFGGTGLGLSITKRLVELMNGTIELESEVGKGSKFSIVIPNLIIATIKNSSSEEKQDLTYIHFNKAKILLVEDIETNRKVVKGYLEPFNIEIKEAENGAIALQMLEKETFDLLLIDVQMPEMRGDELVAVLRTHTKYKTIPIIVLTASVIKSDMLKFNDLVDACLLKPTSKYELISELLKFLPYQKLPPTGIEIIEKQEGLDVFLQENNLSEQFKLQFSEWYKASETYRKSININKLKQFILQLIQLSEDFKIQPLTLLANQIIEYINTFAIGKIKEKLNKLDNLYLFITKS